MAGPDPIGDPDDVSVDERRRHYEAIRDELRAMPPDDVAYHLPNLVDTVERVSREHDDTARFLIGVSFSREYTPLDYRLDRVVGVDAGGSIESIKTAVSREHFYLQVTYPPDPHFDASALRGALLAAVDREIEALPDDDTPDSRVTSLWEHLAWESE